MAQSDAKRKPAQARRAVWMATAAGVMAAGCSLSLPGLGAAPASEPAARTPAAPVATQAGATELRGTHTSDAAAPPQAAPAGAGPDAAPQPDTLPGALALAYNSNPTLQAQRAALDAASEGVTIARGDRFPQISAEAGYQYVDLDRTDNVGNFNESFNTTTFGDRDSQTTTFSATLGISQTLYAGGRVRAGIKAAEADREAARAGLLATEQGVLLSVVDAYVAVRRDQEVVGIRANNVAVLSRQLEAADDRFEVGEVTRTDVAQAEARLAGARTQLAAARADLASTRAVYEQVVGQAAGSLAPPPALPLLPATLTDAADISFDQNPEIVAARFAEASARANVRAARSAFRPSISASASAGLSQDRGEFIQGRADGTDIFAASGDTDQDDETIAAGVTASIPLFTGGANGARVRQARAAENQARLQVRETERAVLADVTSAWNNLLAARAQIESSQEQVRASEVAFEGVEQEALVGGRTTLDVLDAEQELLDARLALVTAESNAYVAAFALLQATGGLTAQALNLPEAADR